MLDLFLLPIFLKLCLNKIGILTKSCTCARSAIHNDPMSSAIGGRKLAKGLYKYTAFKGFQ